MQDASIKIILTPCYNNAPIDHIFQSQMILSISDI